MPTPLRPRAGVHLAAIGADLVALDLGSDAYFCLPGARRGLSGENSDASPGPAQALLATGLFTDAPPLAAARPLPRPPLRTSRDAVVRAGRPREAAQFLSAMLYVARTFPGRPIRSLIAGVGAGSEPSCTEAAESELVRRAVLFDRWLPWVPAQGLCLYRAYALRRFLRAGGLGAEWVFGVRTWPFSAHCWLQAGDLLLDDDPDRVGLYTPILVA